MNELKEPVSRNNMIVYKLYDVFQDSHGERHFVQERTTQEKRFWTLLEVAREPERRIQISFAVQSVMILKDLDVI